MSHMVISWLSVNIVQRQQKAGALCRHVSCKHTSCTRATMALPTPRLSRDAGDLHPKPCCIRHDNMWQLSSATYLTWHRPARSLQDPEKSAVMANSGSRCYHNLNHAACFSGPRKMWLQRASGALGQECEGSAGMQSPDHRLSLTLCRFKGELQ